MRSRIAWLLIFCAGCSRLASPAPRVDPSVQHATGAVVEQARVQLESYSANEPWPLIIGSTGIVGLFLSALVIVTTIWIRRTVQRHSYLREKPVWEAQRKRK